MKRFISAMALLAVLCVFSVSGQVVTSSPAVLQQSSKDIYIDFYPSEGNKGMNGKTNCYAHTGVITNKSTSSSDWKYAPEWLDNSAKYKMALKSGPRRWRLTIGDIRQFYGITDPDEKVLKLAFVFRTADGSAEGKNADGSDIFIDVYDDGLAVSLTSNSSTGIVTAANPSVTFTINASTAADLKLYLNDKNSTPVFSASNATVGTYTHNFTTPGDYKIIAVATSGSLTEERVMNICRREDSKQAAYSGTLKQGATVNSDGSVTFCILAPNKSNVMLVGEWNDYTPSNSCVMNYQGNKYFWVKVPGLDMNKEYGYYFIVDDVNIVGDPYARLVLDPWNDKYINEKANIYPDLKPFPTKVGNNIISVFKGNGYPYNWEVKDFAKPDKGNLVIYELLVRDFTDERSLNAAIAKLDYIRGLGVNAVQLMPVQEFSGNNSWGYNPTFYFAPDKAYGTPVDYKRFVDECHKRGMAVILDVVYNHSWGDHPWCKLYWNASENIPSTDNPFFNPNAPHNFSVGNDWRHENDIVRQYFCDNLKFWMEEYKIDGFRFDLVKGLGDSNSYSGNYDADRYNSSRLANMRRYANAIQSVDPKAYIICESFIDNSEEREMGGFGAMSWRKMCSPAQQMIGGFSSSSDFSGMNDKDNYWVSFMESHDEERNAFWASQYANSSVKGNNPVTMRRIGSAAALTFLSPGAKMIWQFEEMGYDESIESNGGRTDPKPTHWEYLDDANRAGLVKSFSEIVGLRTNNPGLFNSTGEFYPSYTTSNWANGRFITARNKAEGKELVVAVNPTFADATYSYTFDNPNGQYVVNSHSYGVTPTVNAANGSIFVPAHSYVVISNMKDPFSGVDDAVVDNKGSINVFPNPATDFVTVDCTDVEAISVYSLTGSEVARSVGSNTVDVSGLASGNYIVRVKSADAVSTAKLIKK